jgi:hypothetical protein
VQRIALLTMMTFLLTGCTSDDGRQVSGSGEYDCETDSLAPRVILFTWDDTGPVDWSIRMERPSGSDWTRSGQLATWDGDDFGGPHGTVQAPSYPRGTYTIEVSADGGRADSASFGIGCHYDSEIHVAFYEDRVVISQAYF